jgi:hypothetical protein
MSHLPDGVASPPAPAHGARFSAYLSPRDDTPHWLTKWTVTIEHADGDWSGSLTSDAPTDELQTPNLGGTFYLSVWASGPNLPWQQLAPQTGNQQLDCRRDCSAMIAMVASGLGHSASFWTEVLCPLPIQP